MSLGIPSYAQKRGKGITIGLVDSNKPSKFGPGLFMIVILVLMFCAVSYFEYITIF